MTQGPGLRRYDGEGSVLSTIRDKFVKMVESSVRYATMEMICSGALLKIILQIRQSKTPSIRYLISHVKFSKIR